LQENYIKFKGVYKMNKKIIDLNDKRKDIEKKNYDDYKQMAGTSLYNYIKAKVKISLDLLVILNQENSEFLNNIEEDEILIELITKDCSHKLRIEYNSSDDDFNGLSITDNILNNYLINHILNRLKDWYKENKYNDKE